MGTSPATLLPAQRVFSGTLDSVAVQNPLDVEKALVFRHPLTATIAYGNRGRLARREREILF